MTNSLLFASFIKLMLLTISLKDALKLNPINLQFTVYGKVHNQDSGYAQAAAAKTAKLQATTEKRGNLFPYFYISLF